jgi:uncharacterized membrane protein
MGKNLEAAERLRSTSEARFAGGPWRIGSASVRRMLGLSLAIALIAPSATALGQTTTGYGQTPPPPKTETTKTETTPAKTTPAKTEVAPTKTETTAAKHEAAPTKTSTTPTTTQEAKPTTTETTTTTAPRAKALPFTGLDLRWVILAGVFLLGTGLSIVFVQRGRRGMGR